MFTYPIKKKKKSYQERLCIVQGEIGVVSGGNNFTKKGEMVYANICSCLLRPTNPLTITYTIIHFLGFPTRITSC
jgi:hypothetical protein